MLWSKPLNDFSAAHGASHEDQKSSTLVSSDFFLCPLLHALLNMTSHGFLLDGSMDWTTNSYSVNRFSHRSCGPLHLFWILSVLSHPSLSVSVDSQVPGGFAVDLYCFYFQLKFLNSAMWDIEDLSCLYLFHTLSALFVCLDDAVWSLMFSNKSLESSTEQLDIY